jgi:hypothetical protein
MPLSVIGSGSSVNPKLRKAIDEKSLLYKAMKERSPFHAQAQDIIDYYIPLVQQAMREAYPEPLIQRIIEEAWQPSLKKMLAPMPPNLGKAHGAHNCGNCKMFDRGFCWGYGNYEVTPSLVCDSWEQDPRPAHMRPTVQKDAQPQPSQSDLDSAKQSAINSFSDAGDASGVSNLLQHLYGDASIQGTVEAARASGGVVVSALRNTINQLPDDYWDKWQPGYGKAAAQYSDGGMRALLEKTDVDIKGLDDTTKDRLGNVIADGLKNGDSISTTVQAAQDALINPSRIGMIVQTEYARAMTTASIDTYKQNQVAEVEWLAEATACVLCEANADASPISIDDDWPNGNVPVHPNCLCAIAPHVDLGKLLSDATAKSASSSGPVVAPELPSTEPFDLEPTTRPAPGTSAPGEVEGIHYK